MVLTFSKVLFSALRTLKRFQNDVNSHVHAENDAFSKNSTSETIFESPLS